MGLHYIEKLTPLLTYPALFERKSIYRIKDPLLRFWFTFVYPNANAIERLEAKMFYTTLVAPRLDAYWGTSFESMAADLFLTQKLLRKLSEPFKLGTYWDKHIQVDFVVALKSGLSYLGETKWGKIDHKTVSSFVTKLDHFRGKTSYEAVMISADDVSSTAQKRPDCQVYSLKDLASARDD